MTEFFADFAKLCNNAFLPDCPRMLINTAFHANSRNFQHDLQKVRFPCKIQVGLNGWTYHTPVRIPDLGVSSHSLLFCAPAPPLFSFARFTSFPPNHQERCGCRCFCRHPPKCRSPRSAPSSMDVGPRSWLEIQRFESLIVAESERGVGRGDAADQFPGFWAS
jgi:hypothetical protein